MANDVSALVGEVVNGYRLGKPVSYSAAGVILQTEFGPEALPSVIKIRESHAPDAEALREHWNNALQLSHPNLLQVYATGSSTLNGVAIDYLVMERADESLSNVLAERPLTPDETRLLLVPAVSALRYLHEAGYRHGRLIASKVLAVGDQLKLSADSVARLSDTESAADDMWSLGALLIQTLTQKLPDGEIPAAVPSPFREIAEHCLEPNPRWRWTAEDVESKLNPPPPAPTEPVLHEPPPEIRVAEIPRESPPIPPPVDYREDPQAEAREPQQQHLPERHVEARYVDEHQEVRFPFHMPKWTYAGIAALVALALLIAITRYRASPPPVDTARLARQQIPAEPPAAKPSPLQERGSKREAPHASAKNAEGGWWVIVAAYNSRESAEKRVRDLSKRWPGFHVTLSQPQSEKTRYLVILGQGLTQDQANALRRRALAAGLPRDTYIKRII